MRARSCRTLCNPTACGPPGSSVRGTSQARILEWVAASSSRGSSPPRDEPTSPAVAGGFFAAEPPGHSPPGAEEEGEVGQAGRLRVVSEAAEQVWTL